MNVNESLFSTARLQHPQRDKGRFSFLFYLLFYNYRERSVFGAVRIHVGYHRWGGCRQIIVTG